MKPSITTAADLKGKKIATPQLGNTQDVALRSWLNSNGLNTDTSGGGDVHVVPQENSVTLTSFQSGDIDGAWVPEPWATRLVQEGGGKVLVDEATLWPKGQFVTTQLIVTTKFLDAHPDIVQHLIEGLSDSIALIKSDPAQAQDLVSKGIEAVTGKALKPAVIAASFKKLAVHARPDRVVAAAKDAQSAGDLGFLKSADIDGIYDLTLVNKVLTAERTTADREPVTDNADLELERLAHRLAVPPAVSIDNVSKVFGRGATSVAALDDVTLDVAPGEFVCLLGASGCGKSTLLNLVAGLDQPTVGLGRHACAQRIGLMFQEAALFPWLTVRGNVELALKLAGVPAPNGRARIDELLSMVHLGDFAKQRPHELSGGMRQRVALARALAQDAEVLLMDEPFGALDAMTRDSLHDELEALWSETGKTVIFVTHNVREAVRLGDRVVLLASRPGRVAEIYPVSISRARAASTRPRLRRSPPTITDRLREEVSRWPSSLMPTPSRSRRAGSGPSRALDAPGTRCGRSSLAIAIFIGVWQASCGRTGSRSTSIPSPFTVFDALVHDLGDVCGRRRDHAEARLVRLPRRDRHRWHHRHRGRARRACCAPAIGSMITGLQTMPSVAWFPLAIVLFKFSRERDPVRRRARRRAVDRERHHRRHRQRAADPAARRPRARRARLHRRCGYIVIPAALPSVVSGLKQGWAFAWRSLLAGELITTLPGHQGSATA